MLKKWPKDRTKTQDADKLLAPLINLYKKVVKNPTKEHSYSGYELPSWIGASSPQHDSLGSPEHREYGLERDRSVEDQFMLAAFQLGCEQGVRYNQSQLMPSIEKIRNAIRDSKAMGAELTLDQIKYCLEMIDILAGKNNEYHKI